MRMLVLASTSRYRRELLSRLCLQFTTFSPGVDETPAAEETPEHTALRLAVAKAQAAVPTFPQGLIIGSDQVAELDGERLDKPGTRERARDQLLRAGGREVVFHTAVALHRASTNETLTAIVPTAVRFRRIAAAQIDSYLDLEQPFDCAGSAKSEGLGIALLDRISGDDPTALIGLPLIALTSMLTRFGVDVLAASASRP
jgi:septum formation protein